MLQEHQKKELAKPKVEHDAEAERKKKRAAAVDAFKAAQARLGVTPLAPHPNNAPVKRDRSPPPPPRNRSVEVAIEADVGSPRQRPTTKSAAHQPVHEQGGANKKRDKAKGASDAARPDDSQASELEPPQKRQCASHHLIKTANVLRA